MPPKTKPSRAKARPRKSPAAERRAAARVPSSRSARILDVSTGGIALETSVPLEKGRVYDLLLRLEDHRMPVAARVLSVRRAGDTVRASFVFERIFDTDRAYLEQVLVRSVAERMTVIVR